VGAWTSAPPQQTPTPRVLRERKEGGVRTPPPPNRGGVVGVPPPPPGAFCGRKIFFCGALRRKRNREKYGNETRFFPKKRHFVWTLQLIYVVSNKFSIAVGEEEATNPVTKLRAQGENPCPLRAIDFV